MDRIKLRTEINIAKLALGIGTFLVTVLWLAGGAILDDRYYPQETIDQKLEHLEKLDDIKFDYIKEQIDDIKTLIQDSK